LSASSSKQMGRYSEGVPAGFSSFRRSTILPLFQMEGNLPASRHLLNKVWRPSPRTSEAKARAFAGMPSDPCAVSLARSHLHTSRSSPPDTPKSFTDQGNIP
jgi:hypothetical protein